jgi:hypothetical protein
MFVTSIRSKPRIAGVIAWLRACARRDGIAIEPAGQ